MNDRIPTLVTAAARKKIQRHGQERPRVPAPVFSGLGVSEAERRLAEEFYHDGRKAPWQLGGEEAKR